LSYLSDGERIAFQLRMTMLFNRGTRPLSILGIVKKRKKKEREENFVFHGVVLIDIEFT
jgi:hypothetical protein